MLNAANVSGLWAHFKSAFSQYPAWPDQLAARVFVAAGAPFMKSNTRDHERGKFFSRIILIFFGKHFSEFGKVSGPIYALDQRL
jgi:hypothetical protein